MGDWSWDVSRGWKFSGRLSVPNPIFQSFFKNASSDYVWHSETSILSATALWTGTSTSSCAPEFKHACTHTCVLYTPHWWTSSYSQHPSPWQIAVTCYYTHPTDGHHHKVNSQVHDLGLQQIAVTCFYTHRICIPFTAQYGCLLMLSKDVCIFIVL